MNNCKACNTSIEFVHKRAVKLEDGTTKWIEEDLCNKCRNLSEISIDVDNGEHHTLDSRLYSPTGNGNYVTRNIKHD